MSQRREEQRRARSSSTLGNQNYDVKLDPSSSCYYYVSHSTGLSSWEVPVDFEFLPKHFNVESDQNSQQEYYVNKLTDVSSWEKPLCMMADDVLVSTLPPPAPPMQCMRVDGGGGGGTAAITMKKSEKENEDGLQMCAVENCSGNIEKGGYCKTHYEIHLLDVGTRSRRNSGFSGICAAPGCKRDLYRAGYCKFHFNDHQRNLVDHQAREKWMLEEEAKRNGTAPQLYSRDVVQLQAKARKEEERRRADRVAAEQFKIAQQERLAALEKIKARQRWVGGENVEQVFYDQDMQLMQRKKQQQEEEEEQNGQQREREAQEKIFYEQDMQLMQRKKQQEEEQEQERQQREREAQEQLFFDQDMLLQKERKDREAQEQLFFEQDMLLQNERREREAKDHRLREKELEAVKYKNLLEQQKRLSEDEKRRLQVRSKQRERTEARCER